MSPVILTPKQMERVTYGRWRNLPSTDFLITGVNFYTPWVNPGDLFIHRNQKSTGQPDHDAVLEEAFKRGAVAALVLRNSLPDSKHTLLEVDNIDKAFQDLAFASSFTFDGVKVLVTGSHGKTGFKTQLFHVLRNQIRTHAHLDSANQRDPIWRTLTAIPKDAEIAIIEAAVPGDNYGEDRAFFIRPNYCVITGIGYEHLGKHRSIGNLIKNKAAVVTGLRPHGKCILNADDPHFKEVLDRVRDFSDCEILEFGSSPSCSGRLVDARYSRFHWDIAANILDEDVHYTIPLIEDYAPLASVGVLLMAKLLGGDLQRCASEYATYNNFESSGNLYEVQIEGGRFYVYDQSRRGEWKGFESMFELMSRLKPENGGRKIAVLSELINFEDNPDFPVDLERMRDSFERAGADLLYSVHRFREHSAIVTPNTDWCCHGETFSDIQDDLISTIRPNDLIFIRGIEDARLDQLVKKLIAVSISAKKIY
jgi:UDP-N-acetylmuramoyl-tripeptide--D-alanyl-D-alanine ligase